MVSYPRHGVVLSSEKEGTIATGNGMDASQVHRAEQKKPVQTSPDSAMPSTRLSGKGKAIGTENRYMMPGAG